MTGCKRCGRVDSSLRGASFLYAVSALVVTYTGGASPGVYCRTCRRRLATSYSLLSGLLGWWGIPRGPARTFRAIRQNARGGVQDPELNADLLLSVARELVERQNRRGAANALQASQGFRDTPELRELRSQVATEISARTASVHVPGDLVTSDDGELRPAPSAAYAATGVIDRDAVVTRVGDGWLEVRALGGTCGWVRADTVEARQ
jgi:hypothetical protein